MQATASRRSEEIRFYRRVSGFSLEKAAKEIGVSLSYLSNLELGYRQVPDEIMSRARDVLVPAIEREMERLNRVRVREVAAVA